MRRVNRRVLQLFALAAALVLALAACGGDENGEEEGEGGTVAAVCEGSALSGETGLPSSFPKPEEVTYVEAEKAGPTNVVDGRFDGDIERAYDTYHDAVESAGYEILFDEQEADDAEISYAGDGRSGQIALRADCGGEEPVTVHITNRPGE
jgi:hypothetical protein